MQSVKHSLSLFLPLSLCLCLVLKYIQSLHTHTHTEIVRLSLTISSDIWPLKKMRALAQRWGGQKGENARRERTKKRVGRADQQAAVAASGEAGKKGVLARTSSPSAAAQSKS